MPEFYMILAQKLSKYPIFCNICRKINKIPEYYIISARKNAGIFHNNCPKNIFPEFFVGGGARAPVSCAYAKGCVGSY